MGYTSVLINAIVVALMAIYVYQNEKRMEEIAAKHNQKANSKESDLGPKSLALERMESKLNETTAILNRHNGILQDILEAQHKGYSIISVLGPKLLSLERMESNLNKTSAILNRHNGILQDILEVVQREQSIVHLTEVAYGKLTKQSSLYVSRFAVDGNLGTFAHTVLEQSPYWEVDLGKAYKIKRVEIFNRKDCCGDRLHDLDITFGPAQNHMSLCAHYKGPGQNGEHLIFECQPKNKYARYVKLMIKGREILNINEVKVYAEDD